MFVSAALLSVGACRSTKPAVEPDNEEVSEAAEPDRVHPLIGTWAFTVQSPEGEHEGTIEFFLLEGALVGALASWDGPDAPLERINFEDGVLSFQIQTMEGGVTQAEVTVTGDTFSGRMDNLSYNVRNMAFSGRRVE